MSAIDKTWPESWLRLITAAAIFWIAEPPESCRAADSVDRRRPNVIVILVDDMGWRDLACQGGTFSETPHIDRLAASGMRFTQGYSACTVCSPTRAAILTGQYPARLHVTDWIAGHHRPQAKLLPPAWTKHLPLEAVTVAERLYTRARPSHCHLEVRRLALAGQGRFGGSRGRGQLSGGDRAGRQYKAGICTYGGHCCKLDLS